MNDTAVLITRIESVIFELEKYSVQNEAYPYIPILIDYLRLFQEILKQGKEHPQYSLDSRTKILGGFGKIVLDNVDFYESELGTKIVNIGNEFLDAGT